MEDIRISTPGRIVRGDNQGWYVFVEDDTDGTGGFYIYTTENPDRSGNGFDDWVLTIEDVARLFQRSNWQIEWLDDPPDAQA